MTTINLSVPWPLRVSRRLADAAAQAWTWVRSTARAWRAARRTRAEHEALMSLDDATLRDVGMPWATRERVQALRDSAQRRWIDIAVR